MAQQSVQPVVAVCSSFTGSQVPTIDDNAVCFKTAILFLPLQSRTGSVDVGLLLTLTLSCRVELSYTRVLLNVTLQPPCCD